MTKNKVLPNVELHVPQAKNMFAGLIYISDNDKMTRIKYKDFVAAGHKPTRVEFKSFSLKELDNTYDYELLNLRPQAVTEIKIRSKDIETPVDFDTILCDALELIKEICKHKGSLTPKLITKRKKGEIKERISVMTALADRLAKCNIALFSKIETIHAKTNTKCIWRWDKPSNKLLLTMIEGAPTRNAFMDPAYSFAVADGMTNEPCIMVPVRSMCEYFQCTIKAKKKAKKSK